MAKDSTQSLEERIAALEARLKEVKSESEPERPRTPKRLVLCFDGTNNQYQGNECDTNIVKLYEMLDRKGDDQYHYYQPGIGTYVANGQIMNTEDASIFSKISTGLKKTGDQMFGDSFAHHVIAGYQFLMRYYAPGDKIYIFGFSRGAYTARFLSEMISNVGLLSRGNEEMVQFIWYHYSNYECNRDSAKGPKLEAKLKALRSAFCRGKVDIYFLGLFDCVNSVRQFSIPLLGKSTPYVPSTSATHVRHAVSLHERRAKFKPALFLLTCGKDSSTVKNCGDPVEVWFAGNHGDVGGGWGHEKDGPKMLLSDITLEWMVDQLRNLPDDDNPLVWKPRELENMMQRAEMRKAILNTRIEKGERYIHDPLSWSGPSEWYMLMVWWLIECLPLRYFDLTEKGDWVTSHGWNLGCKRDVPHGAKYHESVELLHKSGILKKIPRPGGREPWGLGKLWARLHKKRERDNSEVFVGNETGETNGAATNGAEVRNGTQGSEQLLL